MSWPSKRFSSTLYQSMLSLSFNLVAMLAGTIVALSLGVFSLTPWAFAIYPGILSIRGAIGGLLSAHLSTGLHLGRIRLSFTRNTEHFRSLLSSTIVLAFEGSILLWVFSSLFGSVFWGVLPTDTVPIFSVITATMGISLVLVSPLTVVLSFASYRKGLDPDIIMYPVTATVADVLVTLTYVVTLYAYFMFSPFGQFLIYILDLFFLCIASIIFIQKRKNKEFIRNIREYSLALILMSAVVNVTGYILDQTVRTIGDKPEVYLVYPALIDTVGGVGAIIGSMVTTKLHLGIVKSSLTSLKQHVDIIGGAWMASLFMFATYSSLSFLIFPTGAWERLPLFMIQLLATNILAVSVICVFVYLMAIATYVRGLDPDNFVIPIESSVADGVTTFFLFLSLYLLS